MADKNQLEALTRELAGYEARGLKARAAAVAAEIKALGGSPVEVVETAEVAPALETATLPVKRKARG